MDAPLIAEIAALVGDPARANILCALMGGRALTATELAYCANVTPQTASGHLAKLADGRLLDVARQGRHRYYRIANAAVAQMIEGIMAVSMHTPSRYRPPSKCDDAMRAARTCYDHFAGQLGVGIADTLCARGHVILSGDGGEVTEQGLAFLRDFGVTFTEGRSKRPFCRSCLDWTERRPHIAGFVGAALTAHCFDLGWVRRIGETRALAITPAGRRGFKDRFGLSL